MKRNCLTFVVLSLVFAACIRPPDFPDTPRIEFVSVSKSVLQQENIISRDSTYITIRFEDGDGDIGQPSQNTKDTMLYVKDLRYNVFINDVQSIPYVPEQGVGNGISGTIRMRIFGSLCSGFPLSTKERDTVVYEIYIKDRAGNVSNKVQTSPITLLCK